MSTNNDGPVAASRHGDNNGFLWPQSVCESFCSDTLLLGFQHHILNLSEEPLRCLSTCHCLRETSVVGRVLLKIIPNVVPLHLWEESPDVLLILEFRWVWSWDLDCLGLRIELCDIEEVASTTTTLFRLVGDKPKTAWCLTEESSHRSSSVICTVLPGAVSMVNSARGLTCSGSATTAAAHAAAMRATAFIFNVRCSVEVSFERMPLRRGAREHGCSDDPI